MRRRFRQLLLVIVLAGVVVQMAGATGPPFTDPAGDSTAADVVSVKVTNTPSGLLTFRVKFRNRLSLQVSDQMFLFLDTDRKRSTGDRNGPKDKYGAEYYIFLSGKAGYVITRLLEHGKKTALVKGARAAVRCCSGGVWETVIDRKWIGRPKSFDFYVWTHVNDPSRNLFDYAPNKALYNYRLTGG